MHSRDLSTIASGSIQIAAKEVIHRGDQFPGYGLRKEDALQRAEFSFGVRPVFSGSGMKPGPMAESIGFSSEQNSKSGPSSTQNESGAFRWSTAAYIFK